MLDIEIDGKQVQVPDGSTVMDAANVAGTYIPHFCYHKKLSIAASCRMCLVQVEKAPKPLPACATPVTNGMKVMTHSDSAVKAQKGVMEFLLINHPLDCPICDQGGECQLQDLAVGYGADASRYQEEKRVVVNKDLGPLVSTDMTRCIHCTRCVRFTQEIAGLMEMGQAFRGEHAEIMPFVEKTIDSELSGNIIDLCPVGALTSKPFRFSARTWELSRRRSVSPHDSLGSNLIVQTKHDRVKRVLPLENEELNECWLSDKDRFSYDGLNSDQRLTAPMIKQGGEWKEVDWQTALQYVAHALQTVAQDHGADQIGALVSPHATLEEIALTRKLLNGLGSQNIDTRLRQASDALPVVAPYLGMKVSEVAELDRLLVIGSAFRKDHPLLAQRVRQAAKKGLQVNLLSLSADDEQIRIRNRAVVAPSAMVRSLAGIVSAVAQTKGVAVPEFAAGIAASAEEQAIAASLASGSKVAVWLGNSAVQSPDAILIQKVAKSLADLTGAVVGIIGDAANSVGAFVAGGVPAAGGLGVNGMLQKPLKAYVTVGVEAEYDLANPVAAQKALSQADTVIVLSAFRTGLEYADVLLPVAPFSETSGTFINTEGRAQSFHAVVKPCGDVRPAWKVLRVLGNLLNLQGFAYETSESVRDEVLAGQSWVIPATASCDAPVQIAKAGNAVERYADVPLYFADPLVRRSEALQKTADARQPVARVGKALAQRLGDAARVKLTMNAGGSVVLPLVVDESLPAGVVRVPAAHASTQALGAMFGEISVERA